MPKPHLVFDVNETLLDLRPLDAVFDELFGEPALRKQWFALLLQWSMVTTLTGHYRDFATLGSDAIDALAAARGQKLSKSQRAMLSDCISTLPPHAEVPASLRQLREAGFQLAALTNSAQRTVEAQFDNAGMTALFDHVLSVDAARVFKPHPAAYMLAARALDCPLSALCLVAAHDWDVTGALRAGCDAAFVARDGAVFNGAGDTPSIVGADLLEIARQLIARQP